MDNQEREKGEGSMRAKEKAELNVHAGVKDDDGRNIEMDGPERLRKRRGGAEGTGNED